MVHCRLGQAGMLLTHASVFPLLTPVRLCAWPNGKIPPAPARSWVLASGMKGIGVSCNPACWKTVGNWLLSFSPCLVGWHHLSAGLLWLARAWDGSPKPCCGVPADVGMVWTPPSNVIAYSACVLSNFSTWLKMY